MSTKTKEAVLLFEEGYSCAESVLMACGLDLGLDRDLCQRLALPFAGGMGGSGKTCGALTGAMLAIGLHYHSTKPDEREERFKTSMAVKQLLSEFSQLHGTTECAELIGLEINTEQGFASFKKSELRTTHCARFVKEVAEIVERLSVEDE